MCLCVYVDPVMGRWPVQGQPCRLTQSQPTLLQITGAHTSSQSRTHIPTGAFLIRIQNCVHSAFLSSEPSVIEAWMTCCCNTFSSARSANNRVILCCQRSFVSGTTLKEYRQGNYTQICWGLAISHGWVWMDTCFRSDRNAKAKTEHPKIWNRLRCKYTFTFF